MHFLLTKNKTEQRPSGMWPGEQSHSHPKVDGLDQGKEPGPEPGASGGWPERGAEVEPEGQR